MNRFGIKANPHVSRACIEDLPDIQGLANGSGSAERFRKPNLDQFNMDFQGGFLKFMLNVRIQNVFCKG